MTAESRHVENYTFQGFEAFTVATVVYILLGLLITAVMLTIDGRVNAYRQEPRR
jgi:glutamate/aspartate transport system permease protein